MRAILTGLLLLLSVHDVRAGERLQVYAGASLGEPLEQIAHAFESQTGQPVAINLASSGALARQIAAGAQADVFLSANRQWMEWLASEGHISEDDAFVVCRNRLVLVRPAEQASAPSVSPLALLSGSGRVTLGNPAHVPAGRYAQQTLMALGSWETVAAHTVLTADARAALRFIERGEADLGFVYASDAHRSPQVETVWVVPGGLHEPIDYLGVVLPHATSTAQSFRAFLTDDRGQAIFSEFGMLTEPTDHSADSPATAAAAPADSSMSGISATVWLSLTVALTSVTLLAAPAIACGWLLARRSFPGKTFIDALLHLPLVVPPVVVGFGLLLLLGREAWLGKGLETMFGIRIAFHWIGAVVAAGVTAFPLAVRAARIAFEMIDPKLEEAAATLGKRPRSVFWSVTLPLALPGVAAGLVLALARSLGEFGATITLAGNIAGETRTLPLATFAEMQTPGGEAAAMTLAAVSLAMAVGALLASELLVRRVQVRTVRSHA